MAIFKDLKGKHVFITGGATGVGASLVKGFMGQGAKVSFVDIAQAQGQKLCTKLQNKYNQNVMFETVDLTDIEALKSAMKRICRHLGGIDVVVNNAANDVRHDLTMDEKAWDSNLAVNLKPYFFTIQFASKHMKAQKQGAIINVTSNSFMLGLEGYPAYVTSKAGIVGLSKGIARELGHFGIRSNCLALGWVMTAKQKQLWADEASVKDCLQAQCLKRTIAPKDVVNACLFLASDASAMMSAQTLIVDGGRV